jgi:UMF1 family MFS transporter
VASWVLYDLANTIFSMGVVSLYFPEFVTVAVGETRVDAAVGMITAISMSIIFVLSPILGAMSDRARTRMPFLVTSTFVCVVFTLFLGRLGYTGSAIAFIFANAAYQAGLQFYDSLLVEVTTEENRGRIGGIGVGVGYVGSYIAVGLGLLLGSDDLTLLFTIIAIAFAVFAVPCFLFVKERGNPNPGKVFDLGAVIESTRKTIRTLRESDRYPGLVRFLVGRVFYTDAINTVILVMFIFSTALAMNSGQAESDARTFARVVMMTAITFAIFGGLLWGRMVDRIGAKRTLDRVLILWLATFALTSAMGVFRMPMWFLWIAAPMAGVGLGGIWASDRPLMLRLTPPDRIGEFYGLYGMVGRFSAIIGPALWWLVATTTIGMMGMPQLVGQGIGLFLLLLMIVVSRRILRAVPA